jgi:flagellar secretion chaperone FliS
MNDAKLDSQAYRDYIEGRILSAHPVEIVHLLYQVAIDNLKTAIACLKSGDNFARSQAVTKAQGAVYELMAALDSAASPSMCRNLAELYDYVLREIIAGHTRRSERAFEDALGILTTLAEGWSGVRTHVLGANRAAGAESHSVPEEQAEAAPEAEINQLYSEPPQVPEAARDWSC